jgi:putative two-component system response regulator
VLQSSQLHDIGKIAIQDSILKKPGALTPDEFEQIKDHTSIGEKIILKMGEHINEHVFLEYARVLASAHHEKWDGTGYPNGLKGEEIPLLGRAMAIVDVYDALISVRPYKEAFSREQAIEIIKNGSGTHFDPRLVDLFVGCISFNMMFKHPKSGG